MKNRYIPIYILLVGVLPCLIATVQSAETTLEASRNLFIESRAIKKMEHQEKIEKLKKIYLKSLDNIDAQYQKTGDLDAVILVRAEKVRFEKDKIVPEKPAKELPEKLVKLQKAYLTGIASLTAEKNKYIQNLTLRYITHLESQKKMLTSQNEIEEAITVRNEIEKLKNNAAQKPIRTKAVIKPERKAPRRPIQQLPVEGFSIQTHKRGLGTMITATQAGSKRAYETKTEGNNKTHAGIITCGGGRIVLKNSGPDILKNFKESNEMTLDIILNSSSLNQSGPARIFSSSFDGYKRNFSICQEKDKFTLRLRTTQTGLNGIKPEITWSGLEQNKDMHLLITYKPNNLNIYLDGKKIKTKGISGDFSNWEDYPIVIGNEYKADRPWLGAVKAFTLSNSFTEEDKALSLSKKR